MRRNGGLDGGCNRGRAYALAAFALLSLGASGCDVSFSIASGSLLSGDDDERPLSSDAGVIVDDAGSHKPPAHGADANVSTACTTSGALDTRFGVDGFLPPFFKDTQAEATAVVVDQETSAIVVAGAVHTSEGWAWAIVRLLGNGDRDLSFGDQGVALMALAPGEEGEPMDVTLQPDGKIVAAGAIRGERQNCVIARYLRNGQLDPSYGASGIVSIHDGEACGLKAVTVAANGEIFAAGVSFDEDLARSSFYVLGTTPAGEIDLDLGPSGSIRANFTGGFDAAYGLAIKQDGKIIVAGEGGDAVTPRRAIVARFDGKGNRDQTFGAAGVTTSSFVLGATGLAFDGATEKQYVTGYRGVSILRLLPSGAMDTSYGANGVVHLAPPGFPSSAAERIILRDGKAIVAGAAWSDAPLTDTFVLTRLLSDGSPDPSFSGGMVLARPATGAVRTAGLALLSNGAPIVVGTRDFADKSDITVARFCP